MGPGHSLNRRDDSPNDPYADLRLVAGDCGVIAERLFVEQYDPDLLPFVSRLVRAAIHQEFIAPESVFELHSEMDRLDAGREADTINKQLILKRMGGILDGPVNVSPADLDQVMAGSSVMSLQALGYVCMSVRLSLTDTIKQAGTMLMIGRPAEKDLDPGPGNSNRGDLQRIVAPARINPELISTPLEREELQLISKIVKERLFSHYIAPDQIKALHGDIGDALAERTAQSQSQSLLLREIRKVEGGDQISYDQIVQVLAATSSSQMKTLNYICYVLNLDLASVLKSARDSNSE